MPHPSLRSVRLIALAFGLSAFAACSGGGGSSTSPAPTPEPPGPAESLTQCCGATPPGYFKVNDDWSPTTCGNPSSITYNVCTYRLYSNKPVGTQMTICNGQPIPSNWGQVNTDWSPTSCGHPSSISQNVETVKRNS